MLFSFSSVLISYVFRSIEFLRNVPRGGETRFAEACPRSIGFLKQPCISLNSTGLPPSTVMSLAYPASRSTTGCEPMRRAETGFYCFFPQGVSLLPIETPGGSIPPYAVHHPHSRMLPHDPEEPKLFQVRPWSVLISTRFLPVEANSRLGLVGSTAKCRR